MSVLAEIVTATRADLQRRVTDASFDAIRNAATQRLAQLPCLNVEQALRGPDVAVIAEVKRRSPSAGTLAEIPEPAALASTYQAGGADMVSVLTEPTWFHGSLQDLQHVRQAVTVPVLRKDFIVDEYQIVEACAAGADAILLIVAALPGDELPRLLKVVHQWQMSALVEVHDESEAARAADAGARIIGVNARNLDTLQVDPETFARVVHEIPDQAIKVAESGLHSPDDVAKAVHAGADAVLVGQALVQSSNPAGLIKAMKEAAHVAH